MADRSWVRRFGMALTVFGCGWALMGLEIVGGRMLSPYFGSGIHVWGSVISVFLVALSVGYYLGGLLSHRLAHGAGLAALIWIAGLTVVPVAFQHQAVSTWFAERDMHEKWGSLFAAVVLFFLPCTLLGMVSPYAVRLVAQSVATVGRSAGTLYAISTIGSCLGCLVTSFYFILWVGIRAILLLYAAALLLIAIWLALTWYLGAPHKKEG